MLTQSDKGILGFVIASFVVIWWGSLPPIWLLCVLLFVALGLLFNTKSYFVISSLFAFMYFAYNGYQYKRFSLPSDYIGQALLIEGRVSDLIPLDKTGASFTFHANKLGKHKIWSAKKLRLSWMYPNFKFQQGQKLRLLVSLKRPQGVTNQHGFNYQKWLVSKQILATGYVKTSPSNRVLDNQISLRQRLVDKLKQAAFKHQGEILALALGDKSNMSTASQELIQLSGTAHLFAISGMHLGIVMVFSYFLIKPFCALLLPTLYRLLLKFKYLALNRDGLVRPYNRAQVHLKLISFSLAAINATFYAYLSGFQLPVVRALLMVFFVLLLYYLRANWRLVPLAIHLLAIFILILPFSPLSLSFWFSFSAVAFIYFILWRGKHRQSAFKQSLWLQLLLSIFTLPIIAFAFKSLSLISPFANFVAVPLVTFLLVPLCLLGVFLLCLEFDRFGYFIFEACDLIIGALLAFIRFLLSFPYSTLALPSFGLGATLLLLLAFVVMFMPYLKKKTYLALVLCIPFLSYFLPLKRDALFIDVLDVGHGLAVIVRHNNFVMLYDTGAKYPSGFSFAASAILPFMKANKIDQIDLFVLSHSDNDHSGGASIIQHALKVGVRMSPEDMCVKGQQLTLDDAALAFEVFWPLSIVEDPKNNASCVMKLTHLKSGYSLLLTGDIEKEAEEALVDMHKKGDIELNANILIAPHHGSQTSSSSAFVERVMPQYVVFSSGQNKRWDMPHPRVLNRYLEIGSSTFNTASDGQVSFVVDEEIHSNAYKRNRANYWYLKP